MNRRLTRTSFIRRRCRLGCSREAGRSPLIRVDQIAYARSHRDIPILIQNRAVGKLATGARLDELVAEYEHDRRVAPRRSERSKQYFLAGHDGVPASGESTTRIEEHVALVLFGLCNAGGRLVCQSGDRVRLIAYQVPLKARQTD